MVFYKMQEKQSSGNRDFFGVSSSFYSDTGGKCAGGLRQNRGISEKVQSTRPVFQSGYSRRTVWSSTELKMERSGSRSAKPA